MKSKVTAKRLIGLGFLLAGLIVAGCGETGGGDKETVKIAFIGPLTGSQSAGGQGGLNGITLAINDANADPNFKYQYELVPVDDECKEDVAVQAVLSVATDDDVVAASGHYCSATALATADLYHQYELPNVVWAAGHPDVTYGNDYPEMMRVLGTLIEQNQVNAEWAFDQGYRRVAALYETSDYGQSHYDNFSSAFEELGGEIVISKGVHKDATDVTAELTEIKATNPDAIYLGSSAPLSIAALLNMERLGMDDIQIIGTSGMRITQVPDTAGSAAEGAVIFVDGRPIEKMPGGPKLQADYEAANFDVKIQIPWTPFAYAAGTLIVEAIEAVGPDRVAITKYLNENTTNKETVFGTVTFDENGQNVDAPFTQYVVQDGAWVPFEDSEFATGVRELIPPK